MDVYSAIALDIFRQAHKTTAYSREINWKTINLRHMAGYEFEE